MLLSFVIPSAPPSWIDPCPPCGTPLGQVHGSTSCHVESLADAALKRLPWEKSIFSRLNFRPSLVVIKLKKSGIFNYPTIGIAHI